MLRKWFGPRALLWHLLVIVIVAGCLIAGWWQVHRAMAGNALSYAYSVEWPIFAIVAVVGWWQLIMEHPSEVEARKEERRRRGRANPVAFDEELLRRELATRPDLIKAFPELARAFPELVRPEVGAGRDAPVALAEHAGTPGAPVVPDSCGASVVSGTSVVSGAPVVPGTSVMLIAVAPDGDGGTAAPSEELRSYNDALAALATAGRAKSWRNPRGR